MGRRGRPLCPESSRVRALGTVQSQQFYKEVRPVVKSSESTELGTDVFDRFSLLKSKRKDFRTPRRGD